MRQISISTLGACVGASAASKAEIDRLALEALDKQGLALIDLKLVVDADFAARIRTEAERQRGRVAVR